MLTLIKMFTVDFTEAEALMARRNVLRDTELWKPPKMRRSRAVLSATAAPQQALKDYYYSQKHARLNAKGTTPDLCSHSPSFRNPFRECHVPIEATEGPPLSSVYPRSICLS